MSRYFAVSLTSPLQVSNFPIYRKVTGKTCVMDFGLYATAHNETESIGPESHALVEYGIGVNSFERNADGTGTRQRAKVIE